MWSYILLAMDSEVCTDIRVGVSKGSSGAMEPVDFCKRYNVACWLFKVGLNVLWNT